MNGYHDIYLQGTVTITSVLLHLDVAESVNITEGGNLGPIVCSAECHPNCSYVWKYKKIGGSFSDIDSS
jgi:hypothetical protein